MGLLLRLRANVSLVDTSLINSITLHSETKKKRQVFVCIYGYIHVYGIDIILANLVVAPLTRKVPREH